MPFSDTPEELLTRLVDAPDHPYPRDIIQEMIDRHGKRNQVCAELTEV